MTSLATGLERATRYQDERIYDMVGYKGQTGSVQDWDTMVVYCQHRYYSRLTGRWLTRDPLGLEGGINVYEFCGNNPLMNTDPGGLLYMPISNGGEGVGGDNGYWHQVGEVFGGYGDALRDTVVSSITNNPASPWGMYNQMQSAWQMSKDPDAAYHQMCDGVVHFGNSLAANGSPRDFGDAWGKVYIAAAGAKTGIPEGDGSCLGGTCFVAGTQVQIVPDASPVKFDSTESGTESIETIKPGTAVQTADQFSGVRDQQQTTAFLVHQLNTVETLSFADCDDGPVVERITCTPQHPFFTTRGLVEAGDLCKGDTVQTRDGHGMVLVDETEKHGLYTVYNLTVDKDHTYYVGAAHGGIWVHNTCPLDPVGTATESFNNTGLTDAARALDKHFGRTPGNLWPEPTGNVDAKNMLAESVVQQIVDASGNPSFKGGTTWDYRIPDGRGMRFKNGKLWGFLDP